MPPDSERMDAESAANLVAYLLQRNGIPASESLLQADRALPIGSSIVTYGALFSATKL